MACNSYPSRVSLKDTGSCSCLNMLQPYCSLSKPTLQSFDMRCKEPNTLQKNVLRILINSNLIYGVKFLYCSGHFSYGFLNLPLIDIRSLSSVHIYWAHPTYYVPELQQNINIRFIFWSFSYFKGNIKK